MTYALQLALSFPSYILASLHPSDDFTRLLMICSSVEALNLPPRGTKFLSEKTFSASSSYALIASAADNLKRPRSIAIRLLDSVMSQIRIDVRSACLNSPSCARPANEIKILSRFRGLRQRQSLSKLFHQALNDSEFR